MTALSLALLALGAGLGFSVTDPWSSNGSLPSTTKAATVAGIYLTVAAVLASAVGGYVAGRLRSLWPGVPHHEAFFRDTVHGVTAWAVSALAAAALLGSVGALLAGGAVSAGKVSPFTPITDRLFLGTGDDASRATADRLLSNLTKEHTLTDEQRQSLATLVAARTNIPQADAEKRVSAVETDARTAAETARHVAMQLSFWFVAAMFAGALAAGLAGWEGGAVRDGRMIYGRD